MKTLPSKINWKITSKCDMFPRCDFCFVSEFEDSDIKIRKLICDKLIELSPQMVVISGGEPTQCDDLSMLIKRLKSYKIKVCLATNGTALLNVFPDFYKYIDIITLPLEGDIITHSYLRSEINFKKVIDILDLLRSNKIDQKYSPQILINTVLLANNIDKLSNVAEIVEKYGVDVWKIFEYIHYENINPCKETNHINMETVINELKSKINNKIIVKYESCKMRNSRYFMINPNGSVVIPTLYKDNTFYEKKIGSFIDDSDIVLSNWEIEFDRQNYSDSIKILRMETK